MKGRDIIAKIIAEDGLDKEYAFENGKKIIKKIKEPKTLGEIAKVSYEFGILVLRVNNPIAARKFGLSEQIRAVKDKMRRQIIGNNLP